MLNETIYEASKSHTGTNCANSGRTRMHPLSKTLNRPTSSQLRDTSQDRTPPGHVAHATSKGGPSPVDRSPDGTSRPSIEERALKREQHAVRLAFSRRVIELAVTRVFDVDPTQLSAFSRGVARAAHARQVAMYLGHVACQLSLTDVGRMFCRDRTTVAHACAVIEDARDDPSFDRALDLLESAVPVLASRANSTLAIS